MACLDQDKCGRNRFEADLDAIASAPGDAGFVFQNRKVRRSSRPSRAAGPNLGVIPLIETARGIANLPMICELSCLSRIAFGAIDFQNDLGIDGDGIELLMFRSRIVLESRLAGLPPPIDGVTLDIAVPQSVAEDAASARRIGFGAKLRIHPNQIEPVHAAFAWSEADRAWARKVVAAAESSGGGATVIDDRMVDAPILARARRILEREEEIAPDGGQVAQGRGSSR